MTPDGEEKSKINRKNLHEFVPEQRNKHATVPELKLQENTFLTFFGYHI